MKRSKRARIGQSTIPQDVHRAARPNHMWAQDVQFDRTIDCLVFKYHDIMDDFAKKALVAKVEVERSGTGAVIVTFLETPISIQGTPEFRARG